MKSYVAFIFNVHRLFEGSKRVYLWTFTFKEAQPAWWTASAWARLRKDLFNFFGKFRGVRVTEMHRLHGVHFHVLVDVRLPIVVVRRLAQRYGFGRIHVCIADIGSATYLGKYLSKQESLPCSGRKWSAFGDPVATRVRDIHVQSELGSRVSEVLAQHPGISRRERFGIVRREYQRYINESSEYPVAEQNYTA